MAVPKRKTSKGKLKRKRNSHYGKKVVTSVKTEDKKGYKRPHVDEYVKIK